MNKKLIIFDFDDTLTDNSERDLQSFQHIINNVQGLQHINKNSMVDITPLEAFELIENTFNNLEKIVYAPPTELFKVMYYFHLSPKELLTVKRFNRKTLITLLEMITM